MSYRIHGLFRELADEVAMVASEPATQILTKLFREVADEIHAVFDRWQDPLEACVNALAETHADYRKRSDAQKREGMLDAIGFALNECPEEFSTGSEAHATPSEETPSVTAT